LRWKRYEKQRARHQLKVDAKLILLARRVWDGGRI